MHIIHMTNKKALLTSCCRLYSKVRMSSSMSCKVAVCQMTSTNDKEANLNSIKRLVEEAAAKEAKMVFLPEACDYIAISKEENRNLAEDLNGRLITEYKNLAKSHDIWISIGGMHELVPAQDGAKAKMHNCHVIIDNKGDIVDVYKKLHLFDVSIPEKNVHLRESDFIIGGSQIVKPINTPVGSMGLSICYDLRFPELSTLLRKYGAEVLTFPSAFTNSTGQAHWELLLRARAVENQCYVIAAAQYGEHNKKRISYGQAMVVDPWGKVVAECSKYKEDVPTNESLAIATISKDLLTRVRKEMPVFNHRRTDLYELMEIKCSKSKKANVNRSHFMFADKIIPSSTVFYTTNYSYAFTNIRCVVPGHVLVASIRPAKRLEDLYPEEVSDLFQTVVKVQTVMERVYKCESSTICIQDGKYAGQTVPHVHVHILPRKPGDFARNDDVYEKLAKHDRDENMDPIRSVEEMTSEATLLSSYM